MSTKIFQAWEKITEDFIANPQKFPKLHIFSGHDTGEFGLLSALNITTSECLADLILNKT